MKIGSWYEASDHYVSQLLNVSSYLHSAFCSPVAHGNLKAANVLLDENSMPCVCDCSLAILRPLRRNQLLQSESEV
ncbi:Protein STRUBBELIG-RECEPTOR FAMILY 2, partial [Mucuna pruriens]